MKVPRIPLSTVIFSCLRIYSLLVLLVYVFQDKLIFFPQDHPFSDCKLAAADGFTTVDKIVGDDHIRLLMKRDVKARAWMLLFHGNGGTACSSLFLAERVAPLPISIALAEYPGYEGDADKPSQESLLANALAVHDYIESEEPLPVILYGESLGTGVATYVAYKRKALGLILQSPFTSAADVGQSRYPFLPVRWLSRNPFPAREWAPLVDSQVVVLHGTDDWSVPIYLGEEESKRFKNLWKFVRIPSAGHNDITENNLFWTEVSSFILQLLRPQD